MNKYEQLIEFIINDETDKAREIFHEIVVEKSRDIYEGLLSDDIGGNEVEDLVDEISAEEEGTDAVDTDYDIDGDDDSETEHSESDSDVEELEDRVVDLESALDELQAEFDALMAADTDVEPEMDMDVDMDSDMDMDVDAEMDFDTDMGIDGEEEELKELLQFDADDFPKGKDRGPRDHGTDELERRASLGKDILKKHGREYKDKDRYGDAYKIGGPKGKLPESDSAVVREYVETVADQGQKSEGGEAGHGKSVSVNKQSTVAKKNDMGGTSKNLVQGGEEKGSVAEKAKEIKSGNRNVPGGKAGTAYNSKESAKHDENADHKDSVIKGRK